MNPLSALIGGGLSLIGGLMNTSSTQAINAANLQQQLNMAQGAYLPGLVSNAEKAGINPLAVLGQHAPTGGTAVPIGAGEGVAGAGRLVSQIDPIRSEMDRYSLEKARTEVEIQNNVAKNTQIEAARNEWALKQMMSHPEWVPSGAQEPAVKTGFGLPQIEWMKNIVQGADRPVLPSYPTVPQSRSDLSSYLDWIYGGRR